MLRRRMFSTFKCVALAGLVFAGLSLFAEPAQAQYGGRAYVGQNRYGYGANSYGYSYGRSYNNYSYRSPYTTGYRGYPDYGGPTHYHLQYHPEYEHWSPYRGWHTHGHYDLVPHQGHW